MKKILYKSLFKDCFIFFLISLFSAAIIIWVFQAVNYLDLMVDDGRDFLVYINYTLLNFPKILTKLIPFVIFFSIFYIISKYETNNELMILWNIGINKIELVNFFLKLSLVILVLQLFLTIFLVPSFQDLSRKLIRNSELSFEESLFKPKKFNDTIKNLTIYIDNKDQNNFLENVYIKKDINQNSFQVTFAKKGKFIKKGNNNVLELFDGETINKNENKISNFTFSKSDFYFLENETGIFETNKIQEMSTKDIFACLNKILKLDLNIFTDIDKNTQNSFIQLTELNKRYNNITLINEYCDYYEYRKLLKNITIMPLNYNIDQINIGSGILYSCISHEIIPIIPSKTDYLEEVLVSGSNLSANNLDQFANSILEIIKNYDNYLNKIKISSKKLKNLIENDVLVKNILN